MMQVDVERGQEFRKCIDASCAGHLSRDPRPRDTSPSTRARFFIASPSSRCTRSTSTIAGAGAGRALACATSPSAAPRCARAHQDHGQRHHPMKERVVDARYDPVAWLGRKITVARRRRPKRPPRLSGAPSRASGSDGGRSTCSRDGADSRHASLSLADWVASFDAALSGSTRRCRRRGGPGSLARPTAGSAWSRSSPACRRRARRRWGRPPRPERRRWPGRLGLDPEERSRHGTIVLGYAEALAMARRTRPGRCTGGGARASAR